MTDPLDPPPPRLFRVETAIAGTAAQIAVVGDIDLGSVGSLGEAVHGLLQQHRVSRLILDLRRATFLDSTGLRLLLELDGEARNDGWRLTVVRGSDLVQRAIEVTGLDDQLHFVDDPAEALTDGDSIQ